MHEGISPGTLIAERYEIERRAGSGGMGTVYRARVVQTGEFVALKVLHRVSGGFHEARRFAREARILSELHHPGIVSYVTSGQTAEGLPYLVMEWLEGEDLGQRLERGPLSVAECRQLLDAVGEALACAHQVGIVHRDIKPSNLFLCNGRFQRVVVLDFGVAHYEEKATRSALTLSGSVIGTLEYMAPEQARADHIVEAAADIYSLGRVAYQSLSGRSHRQVEHVAAALARAMFEQAPPLDEICPWVPRPFAQLVSRMLAKDPEQRPQDGAALLDELATIGPLKSIEAPQILQKKPGEHGEEQSLYSIVLAVPPESAFPIDESASEELLAAQNDRRELEGSLISQGAHPSWLLDGSLLLTLLPSDSAHDQAMQAARCALLIKTQWSGAQVALATGRGHVAGRALIGEVVDRAARLLHDRTAVSRQDSKAAATESSSVWVDPLSASLLERRFVLIPTRGGALLTGETAFTDDARPVLGTLTPCIGREQELTILEAILARCKGDSEAQAVLITAPSGVGKTRLRQEFLARLRRRSRPVMVLLGSGEILSSGTPYALLTQALRRLCSIPAGADPQVARQRLIVRCTDLLGLAAGERTAQFLGELCSLPFSDEESAELRAARSDPRTMTVQMLRAFVDFIGAWCERTPVILVLDDLHWGDLLTINLVDGALRELKSRPFMVLGLGRPDVKLLFPKVRQWPNVKEIPLDGLSRVASERLVRFVLGDTLAASAVARIAQHAAGNALLLEELIRAESERHGEQTPETVLAILQARMQRLEPRMRLVLGKASVFGQRFWRGGVAAIFEEAGIEVDLDGLLIALVRAEMITTPKLSRFRDETEYNFRHPLMREAAYSLLLDEQKRRWHRLAAEYLARVGEPDVLVLAEHFSRSEDPALAVPYFVRAATQALEGNDLIGARNCVNRGLDCHRKGLAEEELHSPGERPADAELRGELLSLQSAALYRSLKLESSNQIGEEALHLLQPGGVHWCRTMGQMFVSFLYTGRIEALHALAERFLNLAPSDDALAPYLEAGARLESALILAGRRDASCTLMARLDHLAQKEPSRSPAVRCILHYARSRLHRILLGDPWAGYTYAEAAVEAAMEMGNPRWEALTQGEAAAAELELGSQQGEAKLRASIEALSALDEDMWQGHLATSAALWLSMRPEHADEAADLARMTLSRHKGNMLYSGVSRWALARTYAALGAVTTAELEARTALSMLEGMPPLRLGIYAQLVRMSLSRGRLEEARTTADAGMAELQALGGVGYMDLDLRLSSIEVKNTSGDGRGATAALQGALAILRQRAGRIVDPMRRRYYLEKITENAWLRTLARAQLGEDVESPN